MARVTTSSVAGSVRAEPSGTRLGSHLAYAEVGLTLAEILLVSAPALALASQALVASGELPRLLSIVGALMFASWARYVDLLRPVLAARNAKQGGQALTDAEVEAADRAITRAPVEVALVRWAIWALASAYIALRLVLGGQ
ncbi:MAG: hypothetical protein JWM82_1252, partial [Myxococcales bacterium]|nr:hypothetical protein [Myxococcales bacterium]